MVPLLSPNMMVIDIYMQRYFEKNVNPQCDSSLGL